MKDEQTFLDGMWELISHAEYDELQKLAAKERHRQIVKRNTLLYCTAGFILAFILIGFFSGYAIAVQNFIYAIAGVALVFAYRTEGLMLKDKEVSEYENRN